MRVPRLQRRLAPTVGLLLAVALATASPAAADVGHTIIRHCAEGKSLSGFPQSAYAKALKELSATTEEYSECGQLIRQAQIAAASGKGGGGTGGGSGALPGAVTATPAEQQSVAGAASGGSGPVSIGGRAIRPGVIHANVGSAFSTLPTPVLALLAFLLAALLAFGAGLLNRRFRGQPAD
jgi:hypothetical protein